MGSVGISTGRVLRTQVNDILEGRVNPTGRTNAIVVFPNNFTSFEALLRSESRYRGRDDIANAGRGFAISMSGATAQQKENFLRDLKGRLNVDNSERAAQKAMRRARERDPRITQGELRVIGEMARSATQRNLIDRMIERDRARGGSRYGGNISTRNITKADFKNVG